MPIGDFRCPHCKRWACTFHVGHGCAAAGAMGPTAIVRSNRQRLPNEVEIPHPHLGGVVRTESVTQTFTNTLPIQGRASPDFVIIDDPCDDPDTSAIPRRTIPRSEWGPPVRYGNISAEEMTATLEAASWLRSLDLD